MTSHDICENNPLDPRFLERSYQEAMELTQDVANYLEIANEEVKAHGMDASTDVFYASESMRLSTCLMQVLSWFLVQKGVASGEISKAEANEAKFRLGSKEVCLRRTENMGGKLPDEFLIYMKKAQNLYRQVTRMDKMVYGDGGDLNPVHELFDRLQGTDSKE